MSKKFAPVKETNSYTIEHLELAKLQTTRDWKRSEAKISHLASIPEWYGKTEKSLITAVKLNDGTIEILQGNQRCSALLYAGLVVAYVKVYTDLEETARLELAKDEIATSLTKLDVYRSLWQTLAGDKKTSSWIKAVLLISIDQLTHTTKPKSGNLDWSDKEKKAIIANKSGKKRLEHSEAVASALLSNRWCGLRQSIEMVVKATPEVAKLFQYGLLCRNTSFFEKLPASAVKTSKTTDKNGNDKYSYSVDMNSEELQKCAETGTDAYALEPTSELFEKVKIDKPSKDNEPLVDVDVDMSAYLEYLGVHAGNTDFQQLIYRLMTADVQGAKTLKEYVAECGAVAKQ